MQNINGSKTQHLDGQDENMKKLYYYLKPIRLCGLYLEAINIYSYILGRYISKVAAGKLNWIRDFPREQLEGKQEAKQKKTRFDVKLWILFIFSNITNLMVYQ